MAAFEAAAAAGTGIELDVQLSRDGVPVVFHDPMLERMTEAGGAVWDLSAEELTALSLAGSGERIPTLSAVAQRLPAGLPVLVELKPSPGDALDYLRAVDLALFGTGIDPAIMSFTPALNEAAWTVMPSRRRGVLVMPGTPDPARPAETAAALGAHFLAVRHEQLSDFVAPCRDRLALYAWTVDTEAALAGSRGAADGIIFEQLDPALVTG